MKVHHEPLESVIHRASLILVAEVLSASEPAISGYFRSVDFTARLIEVVFGQMGAKGPLAFRYSEGVIHQRGDARISPLVTGSGLEFSVRPGDRIVGLFGPEANSSDGLTLLRAEPIANVELLRVRGDNARCPPKR